MASFNGCFYTVQNTSARGGEHSVPNGKGALGFATLTTSTSATTVQRGGVAFVAPADGFIWVHCDGAVFVACGETAERGASPVGVALFAGQPVPISIREGQSISVIDR